MKQNVGVIFGGRSVEHEVSIITGLQILENIDKSNYNVMPIYIDKDGIWYYGEKLNNILIFKDWGKNKKRVKSFVPNLNKKDKKNILNKCNVIVMAMHGNYGEDGKLQGFLEFLDIPYTSSGVVGSATGMDKIVMKKIFEGLSLPILTYLWFYKYEWHNNMSEIIKKVRWTLEYPVFVKPANLGSSIGISIAKNDDELIRAIEVAIRYDNRIIVEKGLVDSIDINCSVLSKNGEILVSLLEEPVKWETFLSFNDKYINEISKSGMASMKRKIPADISTELTTKIEEYSRNIYNTMHCKGVVRIDYLLNYSRKTVYVNEINTIPGSLSFYLWEYSNIKFSELIDILIKEAIKISEDKKNQIESFDSTILNKFGGSKGRHGKS